MHNSDLYGQSGHPVAGQPLGLQCLQMLMIRSGPGILLFSACFLLGSHIIMSAYGLVKHNWVVEPGVVYGPGDNHEVQELSEALHSTRERPSGQVGGFGGQNQDESE